MKCVCQMGTGIVNTDCWLIMPWLQRKAASSVYAVNCINVRHTKHLVLLDGEMVS